MIFLIKIFNCTVKTVCNALNFIFIANCDLYYIACCFFYAFVTFFNQVYIVRAKHGLALLLIVTHFHIKVMFWIPI